MTHRENLSAKIERLHGENIAEIRSLRASFDASRTEQKTANERYEREIEKHDKRLGQVEKKVWYASGATALFIILGNLKLWK